MIDVDASADASTRSSWRWKLNQTGHVAGLAILTLDDAERDLTFQDICALMEERLPLLPPLRGAWWRFRSGSTTRTGSTTPISTSTSTSASCAAPGGARRSRRAGGPDRVAAARPLRPLWGST
jgi:hypothetical protein